MFCGNCGAQVPDGSAVCPKCGKQLAAKSKAPQMNQASQNAGARANGTAGGSGKNFDVKKVGIIAGAVIAVIALVLVLKGISGGGGLEEGTYVDFYGYTVTFDGNKMTSVVSGDAGISYGNDVSFVVEYKIKGDTIIFDSKSFEFTKETFDFYEDEFGYDKDEIEDELEYLKEDIVGEDEDEAEMKFEYDKKKKILVLHHTTFYYVEDYKEGPSGKYTCEDDEDITITFKDGKVTYNDDGEEETLTYYCYKKGKKIYIIFGDRSDSDFAKEYNIYETTFDDDKVVFGKVVFEQ